MPSAWTLEAGTPLYRVHRLANGPAFFDASRHGRFNPPTGLETQFGTLYLSTTPAGAFVETLGRTRFLDPVQIRIRVLTTCSFPRPLRLFDLADRANRLRYPDIDLAAHAVATATDYTMPQRLAATIWTDREEPFDGLVYPARHDNAFVARTVAVFGPPGPQNTDKVFASAAIAAIPDDLVAEMVDQFCFEVLASGPLSP